GGAISNQRDSFDSYIYSINTNPPTYVTHRLFWFSMDGTSWKSQYLDTFMVRDVPSNESGFSNGTEEVGWDHRLQATRTTDGKKIFAIWSDSDPNDPNNPTDMNDKPDLYGWGIDLEKDSVYTKTNFTIDGDNHKENFFQIVSDIVLVENVQTIRIPVVTTIFSSNPTAPVTHYYALNVGFGPKLGIDNNKTELFSLSNIYPNPFSEETHINMNLTQSSNVSYSIINMMGQSVKEVQYGKLSTGKHQLDINGTDLNSGMYFLTVKAGDYSKTISMMVQ
ncbi:MAG: T9SS type A sorting domain-containing protein, partial [Bacteroidia bacterium]|nr:T9SS type A sorting domain-containing protein [Bacteroidia bacterium]